jgi:uncharacterized protein YjaG (DUF416 family)
VVVEETPIQEMTCSADEDKLLEVVEVTEITISAVAMMEETLAVHKTSTKE